MNLRTLSYIKAVAEYRHFGKAAAACHVSQPALSTQIKKFENELGITLFERNNQTVRLTETGAEIISLAENILEIVDTIKLTAETSRDPFSGRLRLGAIPTIMPYLVPNFVVYANALFPSLDIEFEEDVTERLNQALYDGKLDAALLATPPESPKLDVIPLYDEPFWIVFPKGHSLQIKQSIQIHDLPKNQLLLLSEGHCFRDQAMDVCQLGDATINRSIRATNLETLINLAAAGLGITLIPATALDRAQIIEKGLCIERLDDKPAYRRIYLTFRRTFPRQNLMAKMAEMICRNAPKNVHLCDP